MISKNKNCDCGCGGIHHCAYIKNPECRECGDTLKNHECDDGVCFTCKELENNRRYRLHNSIGEYAS